MSNSKFVLDKIAKLFEQGIVNYRDFSNEILNIIKSPLISNNTIIILISPPPPITLPNNYL